MTERKKRVLTAEHEVEIVQQLANDVRPQELAKIYKIKKDAMEGRIQKIREKYGFKSITGLCVFFYRNGWIT